VPNPESILFIVVSRIGDTLFATPAIRSVAEAFPDARITVLGHPKRAEIISNLPFVSLVGSISKKTAPWKGWFSKKCYDLAFVYNFDEALVAYALRIARDVVAFRQKNARLNARLYRCVEPPPFQSEHAVKQLLHLPGAIGITASSLRLAYFCTLAERKQAAVSLIGAGADKASPLIGLQVASFPTKAYRDWPMEHFAGLCERIVARWPNAHFLIFGGSEEKTRTNWLKTQLKDKATIFAGRLTLRETAALMSWLDLYVGVDTGPTHLMSTYDIPMVALYHCLSSSIHTGPLDHSMAYIVNHPSTETAGCNETSSMAEISVDQVMKRVEQALMEHPPRPR
jgi:lipopolysaccharide heptosyltransferase III